MGRISAMLVSGIPAEMVEYNYKIGGRIVTDPAAQLVAGLDRFGDRSARSPHHVRGGFIKTDFDWGNDRDVLRIPYSESVFYELHVRGFTKHRNSKVKAKGCFSGLAEKIPYLKSLGVTAVVLLPIYEFDEITEDDARLGWRPEGLRELIAGTALPQSAVTVRESGQEEQAAADRKQGKLNPKDPASSAGSGKREGKLNYWGFGPGWFFAPKRSYSASDSPEDELRAMVRSFHEAGMEVIMEMSFPEGMDIAFIRSCLLWWRQVYHMDGFYLTGNQDDINSAVKSAALSDVKLISDYFASLCLLLKQSFAEMKFLLLKVPDFWEVKVQTDLRLMLLQALKMFQVCPIVFHFPNRRYNLPKGQTFLQASSGSNLLEFEVPLDSRKKVPVIARHPYFNFIRKW